MFILLGSQTFADTVVNPKQVDTVQGRDADAVNKFLASRWRLLNRDVDAFFTNQNYRERDNESSILVYSTVYKKEGQKIETDVDFQLKIDLPKTTRRLKLVIEREQDEISNALSDENLTNSRNTRGTRRARNSAAQSSTGSKYTAGLNYFLKQTESFTSLVKFGFRLDMPVNPSLKFEFEKDYRFKYVDVSLLQKLMLYRQEGFQEVSQVTVNRKWDEKIQTDLINSLVWSHQTDELVLRHNIVYSQEVGSEKFLSYSVGANAKFKPAFWYYDSYDTSISYRQLAYRKWLYGTLTLGIDFPKSSGFNDEKFAQVRIEIFFK